MVGVGRRSRLHLTVTCDLGLTVAQHAALDHARALGAAARPAAIERIATILRDHHHDPTIDTEPHELERAPVERSVIVLNFHPDRIAADGRVVIDALHDDGIYRSQFETGISNGGLTAFPGGDRDRWEERIFGGAYQQPQTSPAERPKYGGLDIMGDPDGPCPRFGSCHLRLKSHVKQRATFCHGDSSDSPDHIATADTFAVVTASLLASAADHGQVLGRTIDPAHLVRAMLGPRPSASTPGRALDAYVETHVHGPVHLGEDVDELVADPSFRTTHVGERLEATADRYGIDLRWHTGFTLVASDVPADFRGPKIPVLARRIVTRFGDGTTHVDAALLGTAARSVVDDPASWSDWASPADTLQHIKQLWHVLVQFGHPHDPRHAHQG